MSLASRPLLSTIILSSTCAMMPEHTVEVQMTLDNGLSPDISVDIRFTGRSSGQKKTSQFGTWTEDDLLRLS